MIEGQMAASNAKSSYEETDGSMTENGIDLRKLITESIHENRRLMETLVERMESQVQLIAECHTIRVAKLDYVIEVVDKHTGQIQELNTSVAALRSDVNELRTGQNDLLVSQADFRNEMRDEIKEVRSHISLS